MQLLFADAATGAHSGGDRRPGPDRRADRGQAGVSAGAARGGGRHRRLHARRHEAELRLRGRRGQSRAGSTTCIATLEAQLDGLEEAGPPGAALSPARPSRSAVPRRILLRGALAGGGGGGERPVGANCTPPSVLSRARPRRRWRRRASAPQPWPAARRAASPRRPLGRPAAAGTCPRRRGRPRRPPCAARGERGSARAGRADLAARPTISRLRRRPRPARRRADQLLERRRRSIGGRAAAKPRSPRATAPDLAARWKIRLAAADRGQARPAGARRAALERRPRRTGERLRRG